ncbi:MAG: MMPL family transporter, partial [Gemmatimonadales bacterium]|nr:MMPL family transporter [Gemmatimonadales bacterium]NIN51277.1 MMPL family transporter [Gemmatimonadales bacterium]NIP08741.1 MMPL family transporter [Gemmatimonadales bacterium]NIR02381.1 MMPL family transporter [Gemmatimonadales bacterium]NIS66173.1 MMPL family transporter [Gemmatimonadales bacterium]
MSIDSRPFRDVLLALTEAAAQEPYVDRVVSYLDEQDSSFVSRAGRETFFVATVGPEHAAGLAAQVPAFRNALAQAVANHSAAVHFEVHVTGEPALEWDTRVASVADARALERVALVPAALVLVLAFGALVAAALPIVVGLYAITCALAAVYVAGAYLPMAVFVLPIVTMVGLGVGIDYSLLLVTRFREELSSGLGPKDAAVRSTTTAGKAVVVSG